MMRERAHAAKERRADRKQKTAQVSRRPKRTAAKSNWALKTTVNHVTFSGAKGERMIAWYVLEPKTWSFRSVEEGESLILDAASTLADLVGTTIHVRVTTRPYPVSAWAKAAYKNAPAPQEGFDPMMERDQHHMLRHAQADKLVYYGVDLGDRNLALRALAKVNTSAVDREMRALQERLDLVDALMAGPGVDARPATPDELEWLITRSFALGCPVPVPVPDPDGPSESAMDEDSVNSVVSQVEWSAEPLAPAVKITTSVGGRQVTRHVVVLTVGRMSELEIPEKHEPWMSKTDLLRIGVEWSATVDVRTEDEVSKEMTKLSRRIDSQMDHWSQDHAKRPPKQLARQADRAAEVEDDMRSGFDGLKTRTKGWYRIAVSGETEKDALDRAQKVIALYRPQIRIERELAQYKLAREFVPGEPLASTAHSRKMPIVKFAAGLPAVTAEVGDKRGFHIGETTGLSSRAVCFDPHFLTEVIEVGGLCLFVGGLGAGKSMLMGSIAYKMIESGVQGAAMDPAGRLQKMLELPELRNITRSVNVLNGDPGSLTPYLTVPDPNPALIRLECENPDDADEFEMRMRRAKVHAQATRRDLMINVGRWSMPVDMHTPENLEVLRNAVSANQAEMDSSAWPIVTWLENKGDEAGKKVAQELRTTAEREIGSLFFYEHGKIRNHDGSALDELAAAARFTVFNLKGLLQPGSEIPVSEYSADELLARPIMQLTSWASLNLIYRMDPNERKLFLLDEAHEVVEGSGAGRALVFKVSTDSRKNNCAAFVGTQTATRVLGENNLNNYVGAAFVGRTTDEDAQKDALRLLGKPEGRGYERILGNLSRVPRGGSLDYREFIYSDGLGGEGGRGGMEKIQVSLRHHPQLFEALNTTADPAKRAAAANKGAVYGGEVA